MQAASACPAVRMRTHSGRSPAASGGDALLVTMPLMPRVRACAVPAQARECAEREPGLADSGLGSSVIAF